MIKEFVQKHNTCKDYKSTERWLDPVVTKITHICVRDISSDIIELISFENSFL